jgi:hypothetical protein
MYAILFYFSIKTVFDILKPGTSPIKNGVSLAGYGGFAVLQSLNLPTPGPIAVNLRYNID